MTIQESAEMYLETIHVLSKNNQNVRAIDICRKMGFSKPSVSRAMKNLAAEDYIAVDSNGYITLKEKGKAIAEKIYERHEILTGCLRQLGVDEKIAEEDACRVEHVISDETFKAIKKHLNTYKPE
jgi:Mn-dependent DtxR family transcriptional regulator